MARMITIGSTQIDTSIFLAPLSGCSDLAFRLIARECGAKFCFFEMIDAHALLGANPHKFDVIETVPEDAPLAAQFLGTDPALMLNAAHVLLDRVKVSFVDINSACPVKKVVKRGAGAGLMNTPETLFRIIETLATNLPLPVTVKLRIGYHTVDLPALSNLAQACEASGAAALFVHGRTRNQGYSGDVNYQAIRTVKQAVTIPVFGSGNVFSASAAEQMRVDTGCDGVLIARGAFGSPWIFRQTEAYFQDGTLLPDPPFAEKKMILKRHLSYIHQYHHCTSAGKIGFMRKITHWYIKAFPNAAKLRGNINLIPDYESLVRFIDEHMQDHHIEEENYKDVT